MINEIVNVPCQSLFVIQKSHKTKVKPRTREILSYGRVCYLKISSNDLAIYIFLVHVVHNTNAHACVDRQSINIVSKS